MAKHRTGIATLCRLVDFITMDDEDEDWVRTEGVKKQLANVSRPPGEGLPSKLCPALPHCRTSQPWPSWRLRPSPCAASSSSSSSRLQLDAFQVMAGVVVMQQDWRRPQLRLAHHDSQRQAPLRQQQRAGLTTTRSSSRLCGPRLQEAPPATASICPHLEI